MYLIKDFYQISMWLSTQQKHGLKLIDDEQITHQKGKLDGRNDNMKKNA